MPDWGPINPTELSELVPLLDDEYMVQRNRTGTVTDHYPDLFDSKNRHNLLVWREEGRFVSFCAVKIVSVHYNGTLYRGGMIGFVYTRPANRARGYAKALLRETAEQLRIQELEFAVLFSTLHSFYERQGWVLQDEGLLGTWAAPVGTEFKPPFELDLTPEAILVIEQIRQEREELWVERTPACYQRRPLSVDRLCFMASSSKKTYCLFGVKGSHVYVYELAGEDSELDEIWSQLTSFYHEITINFHQGCSARKWLRNNSQLQIRQQEHALWKWNANQESKSTDALNHLPYFDRI